MNSIFYKSVILLSVALLFILYGVLSYVPSPTIYDGFSSRDFYVELPELRTTPTPIPEEPQEPEVFEVNREFRRKMGEVPLLCSRIVLGNSYRMFITAYCAEECGWNYSTSSGTICHRANEAYRIHEPTTCAIDLSYFRYGTMFYVPSEDRVYIAEDTGPGVRGMWMDTYQDDISDVYGYNTRYETIYVAEVEYFTVQASNYDITPYIKEACFLLPNLN